MTIQQWNLFSQAGLFSLGRRFIQFAAAVLALSLPLKPANSAEMYSFKGAKLGSSVSQFLALNPEFKCLPSAYARVTCSSTTSTYSGFDALKASATFLEDKLSIVEITLVNEAEESNAIFAFHTTEEALSGKYGSPKKLSENIGGLQRLMRIWRSEKQTIQLSRTTNGTLHRATVMIFSDDHWERSVNLRKATAKGDI